MIGVELIGCVKNLHSLGYVHADIKLDNIMVDDENHIVLIDFGKSQNFFLGNGEHRPNLELSSFDGNSHFASKYAVDY